ncbi:MAG TPA: decaprenyl-phosphate phosphoribosyltransferase [Polyangiaceae bacterium]|jgi:4-hydroxybenzoate polyprenyltransferase
MDGVSLLGAPSALHPMTNHFAGQSLQAVSEEPPPGDEPAPATLAPVTVSSAPPPSPRREGSLVWRLGGAVRTVRPHQWVKNVFVLAPIVFAKEIYDPLLLSRAARAFVVFCLLAGAVYTINDIADVDSDRRHPIKRFRPIASGRVPLGLARALAVILVVAALGGAGVDSAAVLAVAVAYFVLNLAYSLKLKHVPYVDVACIGAGFVLRVMAGGYATRIHVSDYLLSCTALLAVFLGFGKRRHELAAAEGRAGAQRVVLDSYTSGGLDIALVASGVLTIAAYLAYTVDPRTRAFFKSDWLWVSTIFVMLGVLRFLHLVRSRPSSESPTQEMLKDGSFVAILLGWVMLVMWLVYRLRPG